MKLETRKEEIINKQEKEDIKLTQRETKVLEELSKGLSYNLIVKKFNPLYKHSTKTY